MGNHESSYCEEEPSESVDYSDWCRKCAYCTKIGPLEEFTYPIVIPGYNRNEFFVCNACVLLYFAKQPIEIFGSDCINKIEYQVTLADGSTSIFPTFDELMAYVTSRPQDNDDYVFKLSCDLYEPFWGTEGTQGSCGLPCGKITNIDDLKVWAPIPTVWKNKEIDRIDYEMGSLQKRRRIVDNLDDL
jgi:hypothetical protein